MLLKIKTLFSKKNIKKLLRSSLCLLLCVLTVVFFGGVLAPVQAHAVAGVDDAIYFIVAFFNMLRTDIFRQHLQPLAQHNSFMHKLRRVFKKL